MRTEILASKDSLAHQRTSSEWEYKHTQTLTDVLPHPLSLSHSYKHTIMKGGEREKKNNQCQGALRKRNNRNSCRTLALTRSGDGERGRMYRARQLSG